MRLAWQPLTSERHCGSNPGGELLAACMPDDVSAIAERYARQVQTVYLDPPFYSQREYALRLPIGEDGWRGGKRTSVLSAYDDRWPDMDAYMRTLRPALKCAKDMLKPSGAVFVHVDARASATLRAAMDDIFGENNFVNEIIWAYQTGGRTKRRFSPKHDNILFYRMSKNLYFNIEPVAVTRERKRNHMKRTQDEDGRWYSSIVSGGREYRYYEDEAAYPSDVWDDLPPMHQRDPRRMGYDTQKPDALLERIIGCSSQPDDLVADLFCGSGTTAAAASAMGRRFLAADASELAIQTSRKRLLGSAMAITAPGSGGAPFVEADISVGETTVTVRLTRYEIEPALCAEPPDELAHVDQWSLGFLQDGVFLSCANAARTRRSPALPHMLEGATGQGVPAILTVDIMGRRMAHAFQ